jgi:asparagine synthase (glutamine-hydrolysing)
MDFRTWLADDILVKVDRMSMAHSLEVRVPLLDTDFVAYAARLPNDAKLQGSEGKQLFRKALRGRIPPSVLDRPKQGFHLPLARWLNSPLRPRLETLLADRQNPVFDHVLPEVVADHAREHAARARDRTTELWFVIMLDAFLQHGSGQDGRGA